MVKFTGALAGLVKLVKFVVLGVEDESSEETNVLRVEVSEELTVTGSNPLSNGGKMIHKDTVIYIAGDDIALFEAGLKVDDQGVTTYEGELKLDVSKPRTRMVNGKAEIVKPAKLWLTSTRFNKRGNALRNETRTASQNAILALFGQKVETKQKVATTSNVEVTAGGEDDLDD